MSTKQITSEVVLPTAIALDSPVDVESQMPNKPCASTAAVSNATYSYLKAAKPLGIAMGVFLVVEFVFSFLVPIVSFIALTPTIVIASIVTCNCNLQPQARKYATATLVSLCLMFVMQIIWLIGVFTGTNSTPFVLDEQDTTSVYWGTYGASMTCFLAGMFNLVFNGMAIIFSAMFTWKC